MIIINLFLVIGVHKRRISFINVWLILCPIIIIPFELYTAYFVYISLFELTKLSFLVMAKIALLCGVPFYVYSWFSVHSLRRVIQLGKPISLSWDRFNEDREETDNHEIPQ